VADTLSRPNEAPEVEFFDFETTEFLSPEYLDRLKLIEEHGKDKFPDLRVEEGRHTSIEKKATSLMETEDSFGNLARQTFGSFPCKVP